jgi:hypothetical protein
MALRIQIETIPHDKQRYPTVGDWWHGSDGSWQFCVSSMDDWRFEFAVAIHELVECALCLWAGVSQKQVDDFDIAFEKRRTINDVREPGDATNAPYRVQHCVATGVERIVIALLGVSWQEYSDKVDSL